ncbi:MAG TPA: IS1595 family transposase [Actinomycetota bacterium]|nr:IS1595 family transposase [Actinomycetota bacterium]
MPQVNRNHPRRGSASESRYSIFEFDQEFLDDAACLNYLVAQLYPDGIYCPTCKKVTKHHRERKRPSYACQFCGRHEHPLKGTIFENSATSLKLWFYAIYLMSSTRCGISAKQLERELGVTYKTAWRMFNKIRSLLIQDDAPFEGTVEVDEAYIGGQAKWRSPARSRARGITAQGSKAGKTKIMGLAQRGDDENLGKVYVTLAKGTRTLDFTGKVLEKVLPASTVYTDETPLAEPLAKWGYEHRRVNHSEKVYVAGDVHTNTIEGFWALTKRGIGGVYHSVSTKHLQSYLDEYAFRYNNRDANGRGMFTAFLDRVEATRVPRPVADATPSEAQS